jgi:hypothetical protein
MQQIASIRARQKAAFSRHRRQGLETQPGEPLATPQPGLTHQWPPHWPLWASLAVSIVLVGFFAWVDISHAIN